jgi:segregation and condensation protein B
MHEGDEEESAAGATSDGEGGQIVDEHANALQQGEAAVLADDPERAVAESEARATPAPEATVDGETVTASPDEVGPEIEAQPADAIEPLAEEAPVEVDERLVGILESVLFACAEPMTLARISEVVAGPSRAEIKAALGALGERLENDRRGIRLVEVAGGHQFRTSPEHAEWVRRLFQQRPWRLTRATLETLAIVAYKQPITRAEIETIRGVDVDSVLASLLSRKLVKITGRKEVVGRPLLYGTTRQFLEVFGLRDLAALPGLAEVASAMPESVGAGAVGGEETWSGDDRPDEGHTAAEASGGLGDLLPESGGSDDHQRPGDGERQDGQDPGDSGTPD